MVWRDSLWKVPEPEAAASPGKRGYRSPLRASQALATRAQILRAAEPIFVERGYANVSMSDIAEAAGVARQTVFTAFGTKFGLLRDLIDARIAGEDTPVTVAQQGAIQRMHEERDPQELLRLNVRLIAEISERTAALYEVLAQAAGLESEATALHRRIDRQWLDGMRVVIDRLGELRRDLPRSVCRSSRSSPGADPRLTPDPSEGHPEPG